MIFHLLVKHRPSWLILSLFLALPLLSHGYKGLFIMTIGSNSHSQFFGPIVQALYEKGHQMTYIAPVRYEGLSKEITQIEIEKGYFEKMVGNPFDQDMWEVSKRSFGIMCQGCMAALLNPRVKQALEKDYDYVILALFGTECFLGKIYGMKIPFIYATPNVLTNPYSSWFGAVEFPSVSPGVFLGMTYPMTFIKRMKNTLADTLWQYGSQVNDLRLETLSREANEWPPEAPSVWELQRNASLALINSVRALEVPVKSTPPTIIYAGGIHIKTPKPLPKDIEHWINGSGEDGCIYFSLGTAVGPAEMDQQTISILLNVFRSLKQRILWKWSTAFISDLPPNVKIFSWLPQQDILAHPKVVLFMTHGGRLGKLEATYHGVPIIGMPLFADQHFNVMEAFEGGWAKVIDWKEMSEENLRQTIMDALTNSSMLDIVKHKSQLMRDWPRIPREEVTYWVEYVVRHDGAKHLQSPFLFMPWYKIYNVDVWLSLCLSLVTAIFLAAWLAKVCFCRCLHRLRKIKLE